DRHRAGGGGEAIAGAGEPDDGSTAGRSDEPERGGPECSGRVGAIAGDHRSGGRRSQGFTGPGPANANLDAGIGAFDRSDATTLAGSQIRKQNQPAVRVALAENSATGEEAVRPLSSAGGRSGSSREFRLSGSERRPWARSWACSLLEWRLRRSCKCPGRRRE